MKKLVLILLFMFFILPVGFCEVSSSDINIYNLKKQNFYMLDLLEKVEKIEVSDDSVLKITKETSLSNDGKQIFVEALSTGVCDVLIQTEKQNYKYRFISGSTFEDENKKELTLIDIPPVL